jgi:hypothetical protein
VCAARRRMAGAAHAWRFCARGSSSGGGSSSRLAVLCARIVVTPAVGSTEAVNVCAGRRTRDGRRTHRRLVSPFRRHGDGRSTRTPSVCSYRPAAGRGLRDLQYGTSQVTTSARRRMVLHRRAAGPHHPLSTRYHRGRSTPPPAAVGGRGPVPPTRWNVHGQRTSDWRGRGASAPESFEVRVRARQPYFSHGLPSAVAQSWTPVSRSSVMDSRQP